MSAVSANKKRKRTRNTKTGSRMRGGSSSGDNDDRKNKHTSYVVNTDIPRKVFDLYDTANDGREFLTPVIVQCIQKMRVPVHHTVFYHCDSVSA